MIRLFDIVFSLIGLLLLSPLFIIITLCIILDSRGRVFYKQNRVGLNNIDFTLYKFRTMAVGSDKKGLITIGAKDSRITRSGYLLRKYKLDELPQLLNVIRGDMSIVGPRPEVRKYVDMYDSKQMKVLTIPPGITDYASIQYMDENAILAKAIDPDKAYIEFVLPDKIKYNMIYIQNRTISEYFKIIFLTMIKIIR